MSWGGLNQRQFPRLNAECGIAINDQVRGAIKARTENIGKGGVCVILNQELVKLSRVRFHLVLDEKESPLECEGRVVWAVRSKNPASGKVTFDTGIEFIDLNTEQQSALERFLERSA